MAIANCGQPWSEVLKMSPLIRKAYLYSTRLGEGCTVNWATGEVKPPRPTSP